MAAWDVVIIGGGAAGLSAAAAAAGSGLSCVVIDRMGGGGELMNLGPLQDLDGPHLDEPHLDEPHLDEPHLDEPQTGPSLTGPDLAARLLDDAVTAGAELEIAEVTGLMPAAGGWRVTTDSGTHDARAVIIAVGLAPGTLGIDGEDRYEARGLSHCAACDGPLYRGDPVVVAGADRWAVEEARELAATASRVTLVTQGAPAPAADGITVIAGRITALGGSPGLDSVTVQPADGAAPKRLETLAVFIQTGRRPAVGFAPADLSRDADGRLVTGDAQQCSLPGLFAAGDARSGAERTLRFAMEDGRRAAVPLGKCAE
ncbi:MAG TPA: NAD(P)/FAD-dependent oxidoreductase [Rhodopila sp.]|uniref:NAD(P)/FAD-dependent oxidoreductase n=1 Tax=Rhodopila sp. TaxID=2480087 RepID=UPI002B7C5C16|nr:NAD(P)/FAD-dependent oxidoreductase [Rhodopila sp.]HVY14556.1 NAD(P)/FAD-dependent oxidoreductase [Rhodopila sp.]